MKGQPCAGDSLSHQPPWFGAESASVSARHEVQGRLAALLLSCISISRAFLAAQGHIRGLAAVTANTRAHGAPFRHMLFYGPPGARCSGYMMQCAAAGRGCALPRMRVQSVISQCMRCRLQEVPAKLECGVAPHSWCCTMLCVDKCVLTLPLGPLSAWQVKRWM